MLVAQATKAALFSIWILPWSFQAYSADAPSKDDGEEVSSLVKSSETEDEKEEDSTLAPNTWDRRFHKTNSRWRRFTYEVGTYPPLRKGYLVAVMLSKGRKRYNARIHSKTAPGVHRVDLYQGDEIVDSRDINDLYLEKYYKNLIYKDEKGLPQKVLLGDFWNSPHSEHPTDKNSGKILGFLVEIEIDRPTTRHKITVLVAK